MRKKHRRLLIRANSIAILFLFYWAFCSAQNNTGTKGKKGSLYGYYGYNAASYTQSDIHFSNKSTYDFTLYQVKAKNVPISSFKELFSIYSPYNFRFGYYITDRWSIAAGMDHMKYRATPDQTVKISGVIDSSISTDYSGSYLYEDISLDRKFVYIEHTDGLNYVSFDVNYSFVRYKPIAKLPIVLEGTAGLGLAMMVPRTESYVFERGGNHSYHLAGYGTDAHVSPIVYIGKYFFIQANLKVGYVNLPNILLQTPQDKDRAAQSFFFFQKNPVIGLTIDLNKKE